jgi:predicted MFS family arabinose efflux permease
LPRLTLAGAFLACGQGALFAFLVTYLNDGLGLDLVLSGGIFALTQLTGIPGRIAFGWLADRRGSGLSTLRLLSLTSAATIALYAMVTPAWPPLALAALAALAGVTVSSWNGVHLAEVAREAPKGRVGETTSGATLVIFAGYVVSPALFSLLLRATGGYGIPFYVTAALSLAAALALWPGRARKS